MKWCQPVSPRASVYLGAAPRYFFLKIEDHLSVVRQKITNNGIGGMVIGGAQLFIHTHGIIDLFVGYSFKRFGKPTTPTGVTGNSLEVGGLSIGGGLGLQF